MAFSPLHSAASDGDLATVKDLCKKRKGFFGIKQYIDILGKENINPSLSDGKTVLHVAAENGHLNVVSFYTNQLPNPNPGLLTNDQFRGRTPLHYAAQLGHLPVVQHICELLEDKNPKDSNDVTPLHAAAGNGNLKVVKYLVNYEI